MPELSLFSDSYAAIGAVVVVAGFVVLVALAAAQTFFGLGREDD